MSDLKNQHLFSFKISRSCKHFETFFHKSRKPPRNKKSPFFIKQNTKSERTHTRITSKSENPDSKNHKERIILESTSTRLESNTVTKGLLTDSANVLYSKVFDKNHGISGRRRRLRRVDFNFCCFGFFFPLKMKNKSLSLLLGFVG